MLRFYAKIRPIFRRQTTTAVILSKAERGLIFEYFVKAIKRSTDYQHAIDTSRRCAISNRSRKGKNRVGNDFKIGRLKKKAQRIQIRNESRSSPYVSSIQCRRLVRRLD